jgi:hypothetical protein
MDQPGEDEEHPQGVAEPAPMIHKGPGHDTHYDGEPGEREQKQDKEIAYWDIH